MKKRFFILCMLLFALCSMVFVSCSNDEDSGTSASVLSYHSVLLKGYAICLPATGFRVDNILNGAGDQGYYWTSVSKDFYASFLFFQKNKTSCTNTERCYGISVRAVCPSRPHGY